MQPNRDVRSDRASTINQTGIETFFGATPVQLPRLNADTLQSHVSVVDDLVQTDAALDHTVQILSAPEAVVRVHRHGLETSPGAFWVFVREGQLVQLSTDLRPSSQLRLSSLADSAALFNEITGLLAMPAMPRKAYARAVLSRSDAQDLFDLSQSSGFNVGAELLVSDGLTEEEARVAFDIFRSASVGGRISFMTRRDEEVALTCGLAISTDGSDVWLISAVPAAPRGLPSELVLETVMAGALQQRLAEGWSSIGLDRGSKGGTIG